MNLFTISTSELVAVSAIALPALQIALLFLVISGSFNSVRRTDRSTELRKYSFTQRVINLWNSLPSYVVNSVSVNSFKTNIDKFWCSQDVYYNYKCDIAGTGNRSVSNK